MNLNKEENQTSISPIFLSNGISSTLVIPIDLARKYEINKPSHVIIEDTPDGILIKNWRLKINCILKEEQQSILSIAQK